MVKLILAVILTSTLLLAKTQKSYYPDGTIKSATSYKNGKRDGIEHIYYPDGATLRFAKPYVNDKAHGIVQAYTESAMLKYETPYRHGLLDGRSRYYDKNGLLKAEIDYKKGLKDGAMRLFYPTGLLKIETFWKKGKLLSGYTLSQTGIKKSFSSDEIKIFFNANK